MNQVSKALRTGIIGGLKYFSAFVIGLGLLALAKTLLSPRSWVPSINAIIIVGGIGFAYGFLRGSMHHMVAIALKNDHRWVHNGARLFLGKLGVSSDVFRILIAELGDSDPILRKTAAKALRRVPFNIGPVELGSVFEFGKTPRVLVEAIDLLMTALEDEIVQAEAFETLKCMTGKDFGHNKKHWQEWWKQNKK